MKSSLEFLLPLKAEHDSKGLTSLLFTAGFPGESDEAHRELVDFVKTFKFERMGAFTYSEEDGTPAADLPEQLSQKLRWAGLALESQGGWMGSVV
jgi:ribosomal protein S12 methylthiotransferase